MNIHVKSILKTLFLIPLNVGILTFLYLKDLITLPNRIFDSVFQNYYYLENPEEFEKAIRAMTDAIREIQKKHK